MGRVRAPKTPTSSSLVRQKGLSVLIRLPWIFRQVYGKITPDASSSKSIPKGITNDTNFHLSGKSYLKDIKRKANFKLIISRGFPVMIFLMLKISLIKLQRRFKHSKSKDWNQVTSI